MEPGKKRWREVMHKGAEASQRSLRRAYRVLLREAHETSELWVYLARLVKGETLSAKERADLRAHLVDLAKTVPALAIFAAPGGMLILLGLLKVLPPEVLPLAFQEELAGASGGAAGQPKG